MWNARTEEECEMWGLVVGNLQEGQGEGCKYDRSTSHARRKIKHWKLLTLFLKRGQEDKKSNTRSEFGQRTRPACTKYHRETSLCSWCTLRKNASGVIHLQKQDQLNCQRIGF
jgi:hypothetical protein